MVIAGIQAVAWLIGLAFMALIVVIVVTLVYAILIGLALGIIVSVARLGTELPTYAAQADGLVNSVTAQLAAWGVGPEQLQQAAGSLNLGKVAGVLGALLSSIAGLASNFVFLLSLLLFLSIDAGGVGDRLVSIAVDRPKITEALGHFAWGHAPVPARDDDLRAHRGGAGLRGVGDHG